MPIVNIEHFLNIEENYKMFINGFWSSYFVFGTRMEKIMFFVKG